ncbi:MAG: universal stress protein [Bacteroidetes bacterium]|jgi:nucleotide-binding universal stress UspA family protein|nr:universal stress protein [Bacteroidota bacterium]
MNNIFVPSDFSSDSAVAFRSALRFAQLYGARVHVAHGFSLNAEVIASDFVSPFQGLPGNMSPEQIHDFVNLREQLIADNFAQMNKEATNKGIELVTHKIDSNDFEVLAGFAESQGCDLVVMASQGSKGLEETLIGSNTQKFVRYSHLPVLVIKGKSELDTPRRVAFFSTFSQKGERGVYNRFRQVFAGQEFHTHFVMINTPSHFVKTPEANKRFGNFIDSVSPTNYEWTVYNDSSIEEGILSSIEQYGIDLAVLATHGFTGLKRIFYNSLTESVINHAAIPVLSFPLAQADGNGS